MGRVVGRWVGVLVLLGVCVLEHLCELDTWNFNCLYS